MTETRWRVPLSDVTADRELLEAAEATLRSGWWSMGPRVQELEHAFAEFCGAKHAIAVANGTAAVHLALLAVGCGPGGEVILPSLNFVAAANAVAHTGAVPVFCDITGPDDLNLDPEDTAAAVGPRTRAILVLHYGGFPCAVEAIAEVAAQHGVALLEDAAHAPGAALRGRKLGTFGRIGCFSFFANKNLPIGEGGMLVTDDDDLDRQLRLLRSHGMTALTWDRYRGHAGSYDVVAQGFNYRLDEVRAALAMVQLGRLSDENARRARIAARYRDALDGRRGLSMPFGARGDDEQPVHHLAVVLLSDGADREQVRSGLAAQGIQTSVHYPPIHTFSQYRSHNPRPLPRTEAVAARLLTLPLYGSMSDEQVEAVVGGLLAELGSE